jgi:hypothetical protein
MMCLDDLRHDRKSQTCALSAHAATAPEALEDALSVSLRDAGPWSATLTAPIAVAPRFTRAVTSIETLSRRSAPPRRAALDNTMILVIS